MKTLFLSFFLFLNLVSFSQIPLNPVTWKATYTDLPNNEGEITFTATIEKKWHIYSQRPTDAGPIPTSFSVTPSHDYTVLGKVQEENAHEEYVKAFEAKVFVFENQAIFKQKIKRTNKKAFVIKASLEFMTCNDSQCLPPKTVTFDITIPEHTATVKK
jgi:hypothetical protein